MVIGLAVPMFLLSNVAVAVVWFRVTTSSVATPARAAVVLLRSRVAFVDALYSRPFAVIPVTVSPFAVMLAEVDGWVRV